MKKCIRAKAQSFLTLVILLVLAFSLSSVDAPQSRTDQTEIAGTFMPSSDGDIGGGRPPIVPWVRVSGIGNQGMPRVPQPVACGYGPIGGYERPKPQFPTYRINFGGL